MSETKYNIRLEPGVTSDGNPAVMASGDGYIDRDYFTAYTAACRANRGRFDRELKAYAIPAPEAGHFVRALKTAGFGFVSSHQAEVNEIIKSAKRRAVEHVADNVNRAKAAGLYPYQREGVEVMTRNRSFCLFDDMGLGKTVQSIMSLPSDAAVVVACPANVKGRVIYHDTGRVEYIGTWPEEFEKWRPGEFKVQTLSGRIKPEDWHWPNPGEVFIVNYDILPEVRKKVRGSYRYDYLIEMPRYPNTALIFDEAHYFKSTKAKRSAKVAGLCAMVNQIGGIVHPLTGTPLLNKPIELWGILRAAGLERLAFSPNGENPWSYFCMIFGAWKSPWGAMEFNVNRFRHDLIEAALKRVALRRRRVDVLPDLPRKRRELRHVDVFDDARNIKKALKALGVDWDVAATQRLADKAAEAIGDIMEVTQRELSEAGLNSAVKALNAAEVEFESMSELRKGLAICKIPAMMAEVEEHEEQEVPLIVFSKHRLPIELLGKREGWASIIGGQSSEDRGRIVKDFQDGKLKGVACTFAGREGLTLTRAHKMLFVDLDWSPKLNEQAEDRICRIGQTADKALYTILTADHVIDERVNEILTNKLQIIDASVELLNSQVGERSDAGKEVDDDDVEIQEREEVAAEARRRSNRREAKDAYENWAADHLVYLAANDPDHAAVENGVGFNKLDGEIGHSLAAQLSHKGTLTEKQWAFVCKLAHKYRGQALEAAPEREVAGAKS